MLPTRCALMRNTAKSIPKRIAGSDKKRSVIHSQPRSVPLFPVNRVPLVHRKSVPTNPVRFARLSPTRSAKRLLSSAHVKFAYQLKRLLLRNGNHNYFFSFRKSFLRSSHILQLNNCSLIVLFFLNL